MSSTVSPALFLGTKKPAPNSFQTGGAGNENKPHGSFTQDKQAPTKGTGLNTLNSTSTPAPAATGRNHQHNSQGTGQPAPAAPVTLQVLTDRLSAANVEHSRLVFDRLQTAPGSAEHTRLTRKLTALGRQRAQLTAALAELERTQAVEVQATPSVVSQVNAHLAAAAHLTLQAASSGAARALAGVIAAARVPSPRALSTLAQQLQRPAPEPTAARRRPRLVVIKGSSTARPATLHPVSALHPFAPVKAAAA